MQTRPWDQFTLLPQERLKWAVRDLRVFLERDAQSWWVAHRGGEAALLRPEVERLPITAGTPDDPEPAWKRWAFGEERVCTMIRPAVPDRPLLVRTDEPCIVPPGCRASFFFGIPVWVGINIPPKGDEVSATDMMVVPSLQLSSTWFGELHSGLLCYALPTTAQTNANDLDGDPLTAICSFTVFNKSTDDLPMEKICLEARHLAIFEGSDQRLWTNEVYVVVKGGNEPNRTRFSRTPPKSLKAPQLLRAAIQIEDDNPLKRTFFFGR